MKQQTISLFKALDEKSLISLTAEVKEVLDTNYKKTNSRLLSSADLWDIRRRQKTRVIRRFY